MLQTYAKIGGIAGLVLFTFFWLFRGVVANLFQKLSFTKTDSYRLARLFMVLTFVFAIICFALLIAKSLIPTQKLTDDELAKQLTNELRKDLPAVRSFGSTMDIGHVRYEASAYVDGEVLVLGRVTDLTPHDGPSPKWIDPYKPVASIVCGRASAQELAERHVPMRVRVTSLDHPNNPLDDKIDCLSAQ